LIAVSVKQGIKAVEIGRMPYSTLDVRLLKSTPVGYVAILGYLPWLTPPRIHAKKILKQVTTVHSSNQVEEHP
jgi:hypothetical protein